MDDVCPKCGEVHPGCTAHTKATGGPCLHTRINPGATVCFRHGGNSAQATRAAQERENRRIVTARPAQRCSAEPARYYPPPKDGASTPKPRR